MGQKFVREDFREALNRQESAGLLRTERIYGKPDARRIRLPDGRICIDFSSNSYLGLQDRVRSATLRRFRRENHGTSSSGSRMVGGSRAIHAELERAIADFLGTESAAVFGSGFLCCFGVLSTLTTARDGILFDAGIHASLRTGIDHSRAAASPFAHADPADLRGNIRASRAPGRTFIVTDGLFSMSGDFAPVDQLAEIARSFGAWLIVDDAHGIGSVGSEGRGTIERFGLRVFPRLILIGTLSKTLASFGGFVAGSASVIQYLKARSREFIYTTAAPPFQMIAAIEALKIVRSPRGRALRDKLSDHIALVSDSLARKSISSPIVPIPVQGGSRSVLAAAERLGQGGCFAVGMRYPTVPRGQEMIRVSLSAAHTSADVRRLLRALRAIA